jgi:hypothetical protein
MRISISCLLLLLAGCPNANVQSLDGGGGGDGAPALDGGGGDGGGDGGASGPGAWGGVALPWPVFDGTVPDVPPAAAPAHTWYCDAKSGDDAHDGASFATAKKTLGAALTVAQSGDTILLGGGVYRERPALDAFTRLTIGSYGHGTGAPILDGGLAPATWTHYTAQGQTTVWQTSTAGFAKISANEPVLGIYVHSGDLEAALREVPHGQLSAYGTDTLPPNQTQVDIKDQSSHWYFDAAGKTLYADFGGTLGTNDPNSADISILYNSINVGHEPLIVLPQGADGFQLIGLTLRAASWGGIYAESSNNFIDHCDIKFNGGAGAAFDAGSTNLNAGHNTVQRTRIWMNVLDNWPRFNNGNATGGWPGGLSWFSESDALAEGNVVYQNGGEGIIFWGTNDNAGTAHVSMNNVMRHNVVYDNWSVNLYFDNTQNALMDSNFVFDHPRDATQTFDNLLTLSTGYNTDWAKRLTPVNISLADEPGSSFEQPTGYAHLSNITVVNNVFTGGKFGFLDYDDGTASVMPHGLKSCFMANNTIVLGAAAIPGQTGYGWRHLFADGSTTDASAGSIIENNLIASATAQDLFFDAGHANAGAGITCDYHLFSGPAQWSTAATTQDFAAWKAAHPWDQHSVQGDALVADASEFSQTAAQKPVYDWSKARPRSGSPAKAAGVDQSSHFTSDFAGAARAAGPFDIGALGVAP